MVRVMLDAGLRVSELAALRPEHLNMTSCRLDVKDGKGGKDRTLWVQDSLRDEIGEWLERRSPESKWLFCTRTGKQTSRTSIYRTVQTYTKKAEIRGAGEVGYLLFFMIVLSRIAKVRMKYGEGAAGLRALAKAETPIQTLG